IFVSSRRRHTRSKRDWSSDVCSSDLLYITAMLALDGPVVPVLAIAGLASMSLPIGVGGWGIREISVSIVAAGAAVSVDAAVSTRSEERRVGKESRIRWSMEG